MGEVALKEGLETVACPECFSKVILTKENILFCQKCCKGFPLLGDSIPDFRTENVIDFKLMAKQKRTGHVVAKIEFLPSQGAKKEFELKMGHCLLVGRAVYLDPNTDITFVGVPKESRIIINQQTRLLIEKFLKNAENKTFFQGTGLEKMPLHPNQYLGDFERDEDFLVDDKSVSRTHAIFYHNREGLWIVDLVSKNGSYVNGHEVEKTRLKHNDAVSLGRMNFRIVLR